MKKILLVLLVITMISCKDSGITSTSLTPNNKNLPEHLKGLQIDNVSVGGGDYVYVGTFPDHNTISTTWSSGKTTIHAIVIDKNKEILTIPCSRIIFEDDSIVILNKKK